MGKALVRAKVGDDGFFKIRLIFEEGRNSKRMLQSLADKLTARLDTATATEKPFLKIQIAGLEKKIEKFEYYETQTQEDRLVWCADLGDITVGSIVKTIEIDRELQGLNIAPAFDDGAAYTAAEDGILRFFGTINPYHQLLNWIIAPSIQKFHPTYRYGKIYDIDYENNTASVNLRPHVSQTNRDIDVNQVENLYGVPVDYMDCHAEPFEENDEVLVEFEKQKWGQGKVIGFRSSPKPCGTDELVFFSLGELGIVWDITENDYPTDFIGVQDYADCIAYLAGKTETTAVDSTFGLPYTRLLRTFYTDAAYTEYHNKSTTWGLPEQSEVPGYLYDKPQLSDTLSLVGGIYDRTQEWDDTSTPWGVIAPAYTQSYYWTGSPPVFQPGGVSLYDWSSWDYFESHFICPLDIDDAYFSYGTDAEYGNDNIGLGYPGAIMSENSIVQVTFSAHAYTETISDGAGGVETVYTSARETLTACTCGTYPWDDGLGGEVTDPQLMAKNEEFSTAVYDLIEALHVLRGVEIMYDSPDYEGENCQGPDGTTENCNAGLCNYYYDVTNPKMELKLYRK